VELVVLLVVLVMAVSSAYAAWSATRRRQEAAQIALKAGLQFSEADPFDCSRVAFPLFRRGDGRGAENVMWREGANDLPVRGFDFWYYTEHRDENGRVTKSYRYFTCVLAQVNGGWPDLQVAREGVLDRVAGALGFADIDFESDEFNRTFAIRSPDRKFAMTLIDPRMMEFLLTTQGRLTFDLKGRWLLISSNRVKPSLVPPIMRLADAFISHIPSVVWELYPSPFVGADGKPLPDVSGVMLPPLDPGATDPFDAVSHGAFDALLDSPFAVRHEPAGPEYDLDGHLLQPVQEDPWDDLPGGPTGKVVE
jgi:hypothetical protein